MFAKCCIIVVTLAALAPAVRSEPRLSTSVVQTDARTGRLVRKVLIAPTVVPRNTVAQPEKPLREMIAAIAEKNEVEPPLVYSVIHAESNYNPRAVSNKGAQGLMQLIPSTAKRFGVNDSFDSSQNVEGGVKYLKYLITLFHGDYARAVAAYNAGEGAVAKYGGVPPYQETRNYVAQVARQLETERRAYVKADDPALSPINNASETETFNRVIASVSPDGKVYYRTP